jgi:hypothetical protein
LRRSKLTSCRRAIHRLPTPRSLRCRRYNTGCNTDRSGHPARHRSSSHRSKKLLPRIYSIFKKHSRMYTKMSRKKWAHHQIKFRRFVLSTRTTGRNENTIYKKKKKKKNIIKM